MHEQSLLAVPSGFRVEIRICAMLAGLYVYRRDSNPPCSRIEAERLGAFRQAGQGVSSRAGALARVAPVGGTDTVQFKSIPSNSTADSETREQEWNSASVSRA